MNVDRQEYDNFEAGSEIRSYCGPSRRERRGF